MKKKSAVKIIYYSGQSEPARERLRRVIEMNVARKNIAICRTLDALSECLRQPVPEPVIVVLLTANREELSSIVMLRELILDRRIVLVLPDNDPGTLSRGHTLRPRFITCKNNDYGDLSVVLGRMISNCESYS